MEWNYCEYDGLRSDEVLSKRPDWQLLRDGCPGCESPAWLGERVDRVAQRVRTVAGDVFLFSVGHFICFLAARWLSARCMPRGRGAL